MAVMDEFRDEVNKVKEAPLKEQIAYYTYYYKWHVVAIVTTIVVIVSLAQSIASNKESVFYAYLINSFQVDVENSSLKDNFIEQTAIDIENENVLLDTSLYLNYEQHDTTFVEFQQKLSVMISSSEVDMIVTDQTTFSSLCKGELFLDIRGVLSEEEVAYYEPYFYYIDTVYFTEYSDAMSSGDMYYEFPIYNPKDISNMEDPMAIGIFLSPDSALLEEYRFTQEEVVVGIVANTNRLERTKYFLDMIIE